MIVWVDIRKLVIVGFVIRHKLKERIKSDFRRNNDKVRA